MAKTALVTGTTSGIGHELARQCASNGYNVIMVARNIDKLKEDAQKLSNKYMVEVQIIQKDLAFQDSAKDLYKEIKDLGHSIDLLINNAGVGVWGEFTNTDLKDEINMINLNIITPTILTKLFLKEMKERGNGKIMNVASLASFEPGPLMAVYYATKGYILQLTDAIAEEVEGSGITITALCPGPTDTMFEEQAEAENTRMFKTPFMVMKPEEVARIGFRGMLDGKRIVIPGLKNQLFRQIERLLPREWLTSIYQEMNDRT